MKAVYGQMEHIVKALLTLSSDKDQKTHSDSRALLTAICDLEFIFGLCVVKIILSNTRDFKIEGKRLELREARLLEALVSHYKPLQVNTRIGKRS